MNKIKNIYTNNKRLIARVIAILVVFSFALGLFTVYDNFRLDVEYIPVSSSKISGDFNGFKIVHVSDFHSRASTLVQKQIFQALEDEQPDIIVLTGDLIDSRSVDISTAIEFADRLTDFTDVYFVCGNHESNYLIADQWGYMDFMEQLRATGVKVLTNETEVLFANDGGRIYIHGIDDPYLIKDRVDIKKATEYMCASLTLGDGFNILLAHHPEQLDVYSDYGFDVVYSGHAHGGQITLFGLGIYAPDQKKFPEYTSGKYVMDNTTLILSRGIGYSLAPIRFFCSPHIIVTELSSK